MRLHTLEREQRVARPIADVFAFLSRPENLGRITPPWAQVHVLTQPPVPMHVGSGLDYIVRVHGVPWRWTSLITEYDPPHRFVDILLRGPYSLWHHTHTFETVEEETVVRDDVRYAMPFGPLGAVTHALLIKRDLDRIFAYRAEAIRKAFA